MAKETGLASLVTASAPDLAGGASVTASHISGAIDTIVLLRYVVQAGVVRRALHVLKMRGSAHDSAVRELAIGDTGVAVGEPFPGPAGVLGHGAAG